MLICGPLPAERCLELARVEGSKGGRRRPLVRQTRSALEELYGDNCAGVSPEKLWRVRGRARLCWAHFLCPVCCQSTAVELVPRRSLLHGTCCLRSVPKASVSGSCHSPSLPCPSCADQPVSQRHPAIFPPRVYNRRQQEAGSLQSNWPLVPRLRGALQQPRRWPSGRGCRGRGGSWRRQQR